MKKIISFIVTIAFYHCSSLFSMEITPTNTNQMDYFSQLPNTCRMLIIAPLLELCTSYSKIKEPVLTLALLSKKSLEQTNCIFFTTGILHLLAKKWGKSTGEIACKLNTRGTRKYKHLGDRLYILSIDNEKKQKLRTLLSQGVDINYQSCPFQRTALIAAVQSANPNLIYALIYHGANIDIVCNKKYIREYSVLYQQNNWRFYIKNLNEYAQMLSCKYSPTKVHDKIHHHQLAELIRRAINIDNWLSSLEVPIHKTKGHSIPERIARLKKRYEYASSILDMIFHITEKE